MGLKWYLCGFDLHFPKSKWDFALETGLTQTNDGDNNVVTCKKCWCPQSAMLAGSAVSGHTCDRNRCRSEQTRTCTCARLTVRSQDYRSRLGKHLSLNWRERSLRKLQELQVFVIETVAVKIVQRGQTAKWSLCLFSTWKWSEQQQAALRIRKPAC